jgi:hypothetical protein
MRMIIRRLARVNAGDESGATLLMVAISLVAIFGMVVLTVDVGGLAVKRRALVNTNDSAALAAAGTFARNGTLLNAQSQADLLATQNVSNAVHDSLKPWWQVGVDVAGHPCVPITCVTVRYQGDQKLFFAPVIGLGNTMAIHVGATAIWGPAGGGSPAPIMIRSDWLGSECKVPVLPTTPPPVECGFWLNDHDDNGFPLWSWINLNPYPGGTNPGWNVPRTYNCPNVSSGDRTNWILGINVPTLKVNPIPTPTFVCTVSGLASSNVADLRTQIGKYKVFPINDGKGVLAPPGQVDKNGNYCPPGTSCTPDKYDIVGFTVLRLDDVLRGDDPAAYGSPGTTGSCSAIHSFTKTGPGKTWDLDTQSCTIIGLHYPADLTKLYPKISLGTTVYSGGVTGACGTDYCYDPTSHAISWLKKADVTNATVAWEWVTGWIPGKCGVHTRDANAVCIVASWQGPQTGGTGPGGGVDFGLRAIRLSA